MATARLALLYDRILAGTLSSAAEPTMIQQHASTKFIFISSVMSKNNAYRKLQKKVHLLTAGELLELLLQGDGGVVGAKHLRSQAVHQLL